MTFRVTITKLESGEYLASAVGGLVIVKGWSLMSIPHDIKLRIQNAIGIGEIDIVIDP